MFDEASRKACRGAVFALIAFGTVLNLLMLTVPVYMLQVYDRVLASESYPTLWAITAIGVAALALMATLDALRTHFVNRIGLGLEAVLGPQVMKAALVLGLENPAVDGNAAVRDLEKVRNVFGSGLLASLVDLPWTPLFLLVIYLFHPLLGAVALAGAVILVGFAVLNEFGSRKAMARATNSQNELAALSDGILRNADTVWAMGQLPAVSRKWRAVHGAGLGSLIGALERGGTIKSWSRAARQGVQLAILCAGAGLAIEGAISAGVMVVASIIMGRALAPVEQTIGGWRTLQSGHAAWRRLRALVAMAPQTSDVAAFSVEDPVIEVHDCNYVPAGARLPVLRNANMKVETGEVMALIGPSGAGKSTLARLIAGVLAPTTGSVTIGGHSVSRLAHSQAAELIGYVPQDYEFIPGTIAENISGFATENADDGVVRAARQAGLHDMIIALPDGYRTRLLAAANPFSQGQLQRLALARAIYRDPAVLVMDEPSASLDQAGEDIVLDVTSALKQAGKTVVIVAHRPSILSHADRVAVLKNGVIEVVGRYSEILPHVTGMAAAPPKAQPQPAGKPASLVSKVSI